MVRVEDSLVSENNLHFGPVEYPRNRCVKAERSGYQAVEVLEAEGRRDGQITLYEMRHLQAKGRFCPEVGMCLT